MPDERTEQQLTGRRNLLDELEHGVARRLGEHIADLIRATALAAPESRDWSDVSRLVDFAKLFVFQIARDGIDGFDPAPLEGHSNDRHL
jgi:hypothetical protein